MSTKRTPIHRLRTARLSPETVAAWQAADYLALHTALGLGPHEHSPLPVEVTPLGVCEDDKDDPTCKGALQWQRRLLSVAGWPDCRAAYEDNLSEAISWQNYCADLVTHPEHGGIGTGCDPISRRRNLEKATAEVVYRRRLLAGLDEK